MVACLCGIVYAVMTLATEQWHGPSGAKWQGVQSARLSTTTCTQTTLLTQAMSGIRSVSRTTSIGHDSSVPGSRPASRSSPYSASGYNYTYSHQAAPTVRPSCFWLRSCCSRKSREAVEVFEILQAAVKNLCMIRVHTLLLGFHPSTVHNIASGLTNRLKAGS